MKAWTYTRMICAALLLAGAPHAATVPDTRLSPPPPAVPPAASYPRRTTATPAPTPQTMNPIVVRGNLLYDSVTKKRFFVKGITYNPDPICTDQFEDVLADGFSSGLVDWRADLTDMVRLGVNAVRIYQVSPGWSRSVVSVPIGRKRKKTCYQPANNRGCKV